MLPCSLLAENIFTTNMPDHAKENIVRFVYSYFSWYNIQYYDFYHTLHSTAIRFLDANDLVYSFLLRADQGVPEMEPASLFTNLDSLYAVTNLTTCLPVILLNGFVLVKQSYS